MASNHQARSLRLTYTLRMLGTRVALRRAAPLREVGGIIVPCTGEEERNTATVLAAGPRAGLEPGDAVVVSKWASEALADETCERLGEERGTVHVIDSAHVCMRNGKPTTGHVVVLLDPVVTRLAGTLLDIVLPDLCQETQTRGRVLDAAPGCDCKAGDRVLFGKFNGVQLEPATCEALGQARDAEVRVLREYEDHIVNGPRGTRHVVVADEVHGIEESEAAQ